MSERRKNDLKSIVASAADVVRDGEGTLQAGAALLAAHFAYEAHHTHLPKSDFDPVQELLGAMADGRRERAVCGKAAISLLKEGPGFSVAFRDALPAPDKCNPAGIAQSATLLKSALGRLAPEGKENDVDYSRRRGRDAVACLATVSHFHSPGDTGSAVQFAFGALLDRYMDSALKGEVLKQSIHSVRQFQKGLQTSPSP